MCTVYKVGAHKRGELTYLVTDSWLVRRQVTTLTLWLSNIAMENGSFLGGYDDLPIQKGDFA